MARRIPGFPDHVQNFFVCILFHMLLPLLPIGLDLLRSGTVTQKSLMLATAMYALAIGSSSRSRLLFALSVVISLVFAAIYGWTSTDPGNPSTEGRTAALVCLALIFLTHGAERYNRHIVDRTPFWEF